MDGLSYCLDVAIVKQVIKRMEQVLKLPPGAESLKFKLYENVVFQESSLYSHHMEIRLILITLKCGI